MRHVERKVGRQEVHWVPKSRLIELPEQPLRVWTLYGTNPEERPELPMTPLHNQNAFLEDRNHDWIYQGGRLRYFSRVALDSIWVLVEYEDK